MPAPAWSGSHLRARGGIEYGIHSTGEGGRPLLRRRSRDRTGVHRVQPRGVVRCPTHLCMYRVQPHSTGGEAEGRLGAGVIGVAPSHGVRSRRGSWRAARTLGLLVSSANWRLFSWSVWFFQCSAGWLLLPCSWFCRLNVMAVEFGPRPPQERRDARGDAPPSFGAPCAPAAAHEQPACAAPNWRMLGEKPQVAMFIGRARA